MTHFTEQRVGGVTVSVCADLGHTKQVYDNYELFVQRILSEGYFSLSLSSCVAVSAL